LGEPKLTPSVVKEQDRYRSDREHTTTFSKGDGIYCSPEVRGVSGEKYGSFKKSVGDAPEPHVRILDVNGKEVVSANMPYG
jgi:hypothetical protein